MIFRLRSLGCSILLLMVLGTTCSISRFVILNSGMLPVHRGDVAMCFYATVQNTGAEPKTVQLNMKRCCLEMADGSVDCHAMKLQHGFSVRLHANKTFNLTAYFINKNLFGRKGECELKLMSLSAGEALTDFKIQFNTTSPHLNFFQTIYRTMMGDYVEEIKDACDASDMDCLSSECVLDNSGSRSFYNRKKKRCEKTPECEDEEEKMLSAVTNLCRDQYPSSLVVRSLTEEMKMGINDSDSDLQKVNPVEAVKVICVHGKMDDKGHCKCDDNWLSPKFEPQKLDPQKTPYYMCNVRSPEGEVTDRTISTGYAYTILIILVVILLPCCTGLGIIVIYVYQRNQKRKKRSIALLSEDLANFPDKSADVISEVISRREVKKSSTSRRSSSGQEQTTRSACSVNDSKTNSNHSTHDPPSPDDPPSSPHDPPSSPHDPPPSPHDPPPGPNPSNANQGSSNHKPTPSKNWSKINPSNISTRHNTQNNAYRPPEGHHHPTTPSHIYWRKPHAGEVPPKNYQDNYLEDFQEIPLIDLDHAEYDYHENSAFRSRSAPVMNLNYSTPELVAVSSNPENSTRAYFSTSQKMAPIPELNDNKHIPHYIEYQPSDAYSETSETDVRASVKKKQELWSRFLQNYSETHAIRQHSEFGIQDTVRDAQQAYQARSLPIMHTAESTTQQKVSNNVEIYNLPDTRTYTVFTPGQKSVTSISPIEPAALPPPFSIPSKVDIDEVERMLLAAMKSKQRIYPTEIQSEPFNSNLALGERIATSASVEKGPLRENLTFPELERLDSLTLLRRLSKDSNFHEGTPIEHSASESSDIVVGSPRNKFWFENMTATGNDEILKSQRVDSLNLLRRLSKDSDSHEGTPIEHSASESSDIVVGSPRNKLWLENMSATGNDEILKSQQVDSMILLDQPPQKYSYQPGQIPEPASSDSSDILIGSPIGRNKFWMQQFNALTNDPNETPNANVENRSSPCQLTPVLKQQLRTPISNSYNNSNSYINWDRRADNSEDSFDEPPEDNEQIFPFQHPPLAEQDANTTFR